MRQIVNLTEEELEFLMERKILEILGDPDQSLELYEEVKTKLQNRLRDATTIPHQEIMKRFHAD